VKDVVFGVLGGIVGAAVWAGVVYLTEYEIGWIAWGIGGLVGYCVAFGNQDRGRTPTAAGVIAVVITVLSIAGGKYAAIELMMPTDQELVDMFTEQFQEEGYVVSFVADAVLDEYEAGGQALVFPESADRMNPSGEGDYPVDVWAEASERWEAMTEAEQLTFRQDREAEARANIEASLPEIRAMISRGGFFASFAPIDLLFFGLAIVTAWGMGSGRKSREQVEAAYRAALLVSMLRVTAADGVVEDAEVQSIRTVLKNVLGNDLEPALIRAEAEKVGTDASELLAALRELAPHLDLTQKETVVRSAVEVALADGAVGPQEQQLIQEVAAAVEVSEAHLRGILSQIVATA
jgi:uncharacterized tellurite resistance protein B-like protein